MVHKLFSYSKMTVFETIDSWVPSEVTTGCYEASFLLFAKARGGGESGVAILLTNRCPPPPRLIVYQMLKVCPRVDARGWNWFAHYQIIVNKVGAILKGLNSFSSRKLTVKFSSHEYAWIPNSFLKPSGDLFLLVFWTRTYYIKRKGGRGGGGDTN